MRICCFHHETEPAEANINALHPLCVLNGFLFFANACGLVYCGSVGSAGVSGMLSHPMHLHGYSFLVLGVGSLANITSGQERLQYVQDHTALLRAETTQPPAKDTIQLPGAGYAIVRFKADNPGTLSRHRTIHIAFRTEGQKSILKEGMGWISRILALSGLEDANMLRLPFSELTISCTASI